MAGTGEHDVSSTVRLRGIIGSLFSVIINSLGIAASCAVTQMEISAMITRVFVSLKDKGWQMANHRSIEMAVRVRMETMTHTV